jgi:succinylarginine dihydrolase
MDKFLSGVQELLGQANEAYQSRQQREATEAAARADNRQANAINRRTELIKQYAPYAFGGLVLIAGVVLITRK